MSWEIVYTSRAKRDLKNIYEYIAYNLLVPETAARQTHRIMEEIRIMYGGRDIRRQLNETEQ